MDINLIGQRAKEAKTALAAASASVKNTALKSIAEALTQNAAYIIAENQKDLQAGKENGMSASMLDRLALSTSRIEGMAKGALEIMAETDPVGRVLMGSTLVSGLRMKKITVPLGVVAVIYEARPNVTADAAALCLKAGNAVILRGGKEAIHSNKAIAEVMRGAVEKAGLPADVINLIEDTARESAQALMRMNKYVDVLIPRGGAGLIKSCVENATVPVIETGTGNCHVYVDESADITMAVSITVNAKTSRVSVCNACESLIIHEKILAKALPPIAAALRGKNVEIRCDEKALAVLPDAVLATDEDFYTEYLDYIISVKTVKSTDEAIAHINKYGTGHSEAIVTKSLADADKFTLRVDAAAVYVNASTRFTDGGEFGFGAEIGISTQKLHARGPLGLGELVSVKYILNGDGQVR